MHKMPSKIEPKYAIAKICKDIEQAVPESNAIYGNLAVPYIFNTEEEAIGYVEGMLKTFCDAMQALKDQDDRYNYETKVFKTESDYTYYMTKGYFDGVSCNRINTYYVITLYELENKKHG